MKRVAYFILSCLLFLCGAAATAQTPEEIWKKSISEQNKDYVQVPHAMLKIQDAVYLGNGEGAHIEGTRGKPGSWHWVQKPGGADTLRLSMKGGKLTITQSGKPVSAEAITKGLPVDKDVDVVGQPTQVAAGVPGWRIFIYNQQNPIAKHFTSVSYFPYDPAYRVTAQFIADAKLPPRVFRTSRGTDKQFYHAGDAVFVLKGAKVTLPFYSESNNPRSIADMSAFFTDGLTGQGAYGAGRYVDVDHFGPYPPRQVTIDFNLAYNPNCARSPYFTCPVATDNIPLPVKAGERDPHMLH